MTANNLRPLGHSGLIVSATGLGCNNLGRPGTITETQQGVDALISSAVDAGVIFFDVADTYGKEPGLSEKMLGIALKDHRDDVVIGTKFGMDMKGVNGQDFGARGSRRYIRRAVEASLTRLGTDYIDLYQYHEPDGVTPVEETFGAMSELVTEGKVRYIGHSNFPGWMIAKADALTPNDSGVRFISAQNQYSLLSREIEAEVVPSIEDHGLSLIPYFPLYNGFLTGKYRRDVVPEGSRLTHSRQAVLENADWDQLEAFARFAQERGVTEIQVAFGWLLAQNSVDTVIAGATTPEQIAQNAVAALAWQPTPADLLALDEIFPGVPAAGGYLKG
ncbi:MAG: aldo/keto reductase [Microbacteriaceae bacterium]